MSVALVFLMAIVVVACVTIYLIVRVDSRSKELKSNLSWALGEMQKAQNAIRTIDRDLIAQQEAGHFDLAAVRTHIDDYLLSTTSSPKETRS